VVWHPPANAAIAATVATEASRRGRRRFIPAVEPILSLPKESGYARSAGEAVNSAIER
jgi:hypothetical protein